MTDAKRTPKTARQRAEEQLAVSERKISRAKTKRDTLTAQVKALDTEITAEEKQHAYLKANPALPAPANLPPS